MLYLLGESLAPTWVVNSFPIIKFILLVLIFLSAIAMIVVVMMQQSEGGDTINSITGIKETYFSKNKGLNREVRLKKITVALAIIIAVATVAFFVLTAIYGGSLWS
jgi:protein translocase SecG subunit